MLTALLPNSSAPSSRSRLASRRLTIDARRFPCFSSRAMLAREDAVRAVRCRRKTPTTAGRRGRSPRKASLCRSFLRDFFGEEGAHVGRIDIGFDEGLADAAHQNEGELPAFDLLVLRDQFHQPVGGRHSACYVAEFDRQADGGEMVGGARGIAR